MGQDMAHMYLMKYTLEFTENYKKGNMWFMNHFTAAHEKTG